jgi:hypothetical protein
MADWMLINKQQINHSLDFVSLKLFFFFDKYKRPLSENPFCFLHAWASIIENTLFANRQKG